MKKAIANLSFSDLKVRYFTGRSILISDTGQGKRYQYRNGCMTALGDLEISEWREMITELIAYRSEQELQKQLYEWCAEHTPWLHGKSEITDYALECHTDSVGYRPSKRSECQYPAPQRMYCDDSQISYAALPKWHR